MITLIPHSNKATLDATILNQHNFLTFISIATTAYHIFTYIVEDFFLRPYVSIK